MLIDVVVVAKNSAATLSQLLRALPHKSLRSVVVVDCGSTDDTSEIARDHGALVLRVPDGQYGDACMKAQAHFADLPTAPDIVVFLPADCHQAAAQVTALCLPISAAGAELALAVPPVPQRKRRDLRSLAIARLIDTVYGERLHSLSPVRAIRFAAWVALGMSDPSRDYNVEMVVRSKKLGLSFAQVEIEGADQPSRLSFRSVFHVLRHATIR